jgi:Fip1 motif
MASSIVRLDDYQSCSRSLLFCCRYRVVDAPWKVPGAETSAFFNYNLTPAKWRAYIRDVQQAHAEMRMQGRIQLFDPPTTAARDPDMPAELATALGSKVSAALAFHSTFACNLASRACCSSCG